MTSTRSLLASRRTTRASSQRTRAEPSKDSDQVRKNWEGVFAGVPDFTAELLLSAVTDEGVEVGEWRWEGTHTDGSQGFAGDSHIKQGVFAQLSVSR